MASQLNVDVINPANPTLPVNITGPSVPTYNAAPLVMNAPGGFDIANINVDPSLGIGSSLDAAVSNLATSLNTLVGTGLQITVTTSTTTNTITLSFPNAVTFPGSVTTTGQLIGGGTTTNDNAAGGYIGEYIESRIASGSAVALTTNVALNLTSLSLSAGDWEIQGNVGFAGTGTTANLGVGYAGGGASTVSGVLPTGDLYANWIGRNAAGTWTYAPNIAIPPRRISIATGGTLYLVVQAVFSGASTGLSAYGGFSARRMR